MKPEDPRLAELEALLRSVQFEPRASLEAEIRGRWRRGERGPERSVENVRRIFGISGTILVAGVGLLALWMLTLRPKGELTVDRCCQDLDGGGIRDDGLVVTAASDQQVEHLAIYEDRDGSHSFSTGDTLRFQRDGVPAMNAPLAAGTRTIEFCCLDYDGGGASDDALLVVGAPPDRISMAAIYERRPGAMHEFPLR